MSSLVGNLRNKVVAAALLGLVTLPANCEAYQLRGGGARSILQRAIGGRQDSGAGQRSSGNRSSSGNSRPVKRVTADNNGNTPSQQPGFSKSSILEKYGANTNGNWTSMGRTAAAAPAQPATARQAPTQTTVAKPFTPPGPSQPIADQPVKARVPSPAVAGAAAPGDVDLVLEDVKYVEPATETAGPAYRMKLRNLGARAAGKFRIGAFAELGGKLSDDAPRVVTEIASLPAGEVSEVTLRLPVSAVRFISSSSAEPVAFDQLLVVVDLDNAIVETDKSNNVASLERTDLEAAVKQNAVK